MHPKSFVSNFWGAVQMMNPLVFYCAGVGYLTTHLPTPSAVLTT